MPHTRRVAAVALLFVTFSVAAQPKTDSPSAADPLHAWMAGDDPAALEAWINERLAEEKADLEKLLAVTGAADRREHAAAL